MPQVSEQVEFRNPNLNVIPKDVLLSCKVVQTRKEEIEQKTAQLIADSFEGDPSSVGEKVTQLSPKKKTELELMAKVIVSKALDEPQYCQACVSLASALRELLPALPSLHEGQKIEGFMHALLDAFQVEFEAALENSLISGVSRLQAAAQFAGQLYRRELLAKGAAIQIAQDLSVRGHDQCANDLLWCIGIFTEATNQEKAHLCTITEDPYESDGASSVGRRPSCP
mmetsp:Transcript_83890/g.130988  ORF Transcript_83890/g.130988 Transcript_83890/m.130988 type:complete len:226 (+) Transcript_83890:156-833(+)